MAHWLRECVATAARAPGARATEIIHIGQAVLTFGGTIEYFRDAVFNYPTLAEAYKVAALNGRLYFRRSGGCHAEAPPM